MTGLLPDPKNGDTVCGPDDRKAFGGCRKKAARKAVNNVRGIGIERVISAFVIISQWSPPRGRGAISFICMVNIFVQEDGMQHDPHEILKVINAMHDKAILLIRMQHDTPEKDRNSVIIRNLLDDIKAMARQLTYVDSDK